MTNLQFWKIMTKTVKTDKLNGPTTSNVSSSTPLEVAKSAECQITLLPLPSAVADRVFVARFVFFDVLILSFF